MSIRSSVTYSNIILAICLLAFSIEVAPGMQERYAIIAVRTTSVGELGHVGVGFQNEDGTWTIGGIENTGSSPVVIPGADNRIGIVDGIVGAIYNNGGWVESHKSLQEVAVLFHSLNYDGIKIISVSNPNPNSANSRIDGFPTRGYNIVGNNCLSATVDVLSAYNVKNLPYQRAHEAPNDYYAHVQGEEYLWDSSKKKYTDVETGISLTAADFQKDKINKQKDSLSSILGLGKPLWPSPTSEDYSNSNPPAHPGVIPTVNRPEGYPPGGNSGWVP